MMFGSQIAAFEEQVQDDRHKNLNLIIRQLGHGSQKFLIELAKTEGRLFDQSEMSRLVNGNKVDGRRVPPFDNRRARSIEKTVQLPPGTLDLPPEKFSRYYKFFEEYPRRTGAVNRAWFDELLCCLLDMPFHRPPSDTASPKDGTS